VHLGVLEYWGSKTEHSEKKMKNEGGTAELFILIADYSRLLPFDNE
jgi:hypothetical protein